MLPQQIAQRLNDGWTFKPKYIHMSNLTRPSGKGSFSVSRGEMEAAISYLEGLIIHITENLPSKYTNTDLAKQKQQQEQPTAGTEGIDGQS